MIDEPNSGGGEPADLNRESVEFLATLAHDLRTPLNAITGWIEVARLRCGGNEHVLHALDAIERNAMAQSQRLSDLLDVSSIRSGGLKVSLHPMLPASAVELALEEVEADASARQLTIHRALEPGAGPILGEASRIQQVAECLLRNAVRFSADGGAIFVSLARRGDSVELAVRDEGRGIPRDELPQLFDQFRRSEVSSPRLKLGLTIVSYITERHGGTVTAESAGEGLGATFRVGFPS